MGILRRLAVCALAASAMAPAAAQATTATPAGGGDTPCAVMASPVRVLGHETLSCAAFHSDVAVHVPTATSTTVYGFLGGAFGAPHTVTTATATLPIRGGVGATLIRNVAMSGRLLVSATVQGGQVVAVAPWLYIADSAVIGAFADQQLTGRARTMGAPAAVPASMWARMVFNADGSRARIVNYRSDVRAHGACHAAMLTPATASFIRATLGAHGRLEASWNPAMHAPGDSEVVLTSSRGPSYMTRGPLLSELLVGPWAPSTATFGIHGNPIGTVASIEGAIGPRTPVVGC